MHFLLHQFRSLRRTSHLAIMTSAWPNAQTASTFPMPRQTVQEKPAAALSKPQQARPPLFGAVQLRPHQCVFDPSHARRCHWPSSRLYRFLPQQCPARTLLVPRPRIDRRDQRRRHGQAALRDSRQRRVRHQCAARQAQGWSVDCRSG
jgi:hypothetical protein